MEYTMESNEEQQFWADFSSLVDAELSIGTSQEEVPPIDSAYSPSHPMAALYTPDMGIAPQDTLLDNASTQGYQEVLPVAGVIHDTMAPAQDYSDFLPQTGYHVPVATQQGVQTTMPVTSYNTYQPQSVFAQQSHPQLMGDRLSQSSLGFTPPPPFPHGQQQQLPVTAMANNVYGGFSNPGFTAPSYMPMTGSSAYNPAGYQPTQQGYFPPPAPASAPVSAHITAPQVPQEQLSRPLFPPPTTTFASSSSTNNTAVASSSSSSSSAAAASSSSSSTAATTTTNNSATGSSSSNSTPRKPRVAKKPKAKPEQTCKQAGCSYKTRNKEEFRRHTESVHQNIRRHQCEICKSYFNDASGLSKHRKTRRHQNRAEELGIEIKDKTRYACRFCIKQGLRAQMMRRPDHLKRHLMVCKHCERQDDKLPVGYSHGTRGMRNGMLRGDQGFDFVFQEVVQERWERIDADFDFGQVADFDYRLDAM